MNEFFTMSPNDPHAVFFAARMGLLVLGLGMLLALTIVSTWMFLAWKQHRRYMKQRGKKREQHVRELLEEQRKKDKIYSDQTCIQTMPDMFGDARLIEEIRREFQ